MVIRILTAAVVVLLAAVAAVVSYRHAYEVVTAYGEAGFTAVLVPLTIDGLIFASSMVLLDSARRSLPVPWLARVTLVLGIAATLAANVMHGWAHGPIGAVVAAWPAVALVLSYELLMGLIRRAGTVPVPVAVAADEPLVEDVGAVIEEPGRGLRRWLRWWPRRMYPHPVHGVPPQVTDSTEEVDDTLVEDVQAAADTGQVQPEAGTDLDAPFRPVAVAQFLAEVAQGEPPSVRTIKDRMGVGTDRARRLQSYLGQLITAAN
ncbi:DUF2637 domain-containing protein [Nonomuraea sp. NPDC055795]